MSFEFQHHTRFVSRAKNGDIETISLFDNSGSQLNGNFGEYTNKFSGKLLSLNTKTQTATLIHEFPAPDNIFAFSQGGIQILPNGNAFVNWGSAGAISEFSSKGTVIFHAYLDSGDLWRNGHVQNYRGFRFNWTGILYEESAVVALAHGESTVVYVSWNGDTETTSWEFYGVDNKGREILLGRETRDGFKTSFYVFSGSNWQSYFTQAIGKDGKVSRRSKTVRSKQHIYPYLPGKDHILFSDKSQLTPEAH
jgi:arylsulfotransferase ASST